MKAILISILLVSSNMVFCKTEVFFSPDDKPKYELIKKINSAKQKIYAAIYMITDKKIAQALINAKQNRKIDVQVVTDASNIESPYSKINMLKNGGIDIFTFHSKPAYHKQNEAIMHNKFAILDNTIWTGSFNWTASANQKNQENVFVTDDKKAYKRYTQQFHKLKRRCTLQRGSQKLQDPSVPEQKRKAALKRRLKNIFARIHSWAHRR